MSTRTNFGLRLYYLQICKGETQKHFTEETFDVKISWCGVDRTSSVVIIIFNIKEAND
jgi:hypothetical protein